MERVGTSFIKTFSTVSTHNPEINRTTTTTTTNNKNNQKNLLLPVYYPQTLHYILNYTLHYLPYTITRYQPSSTIDYCGYGVNPREFFLSYPYKKTIYVITVQT